jgi:hypothetical protein
MICLTGSGVNCGVPKVPSPSSSLVRVLNESTAAKVDSLSVRITVIATLTNTTGDTLFIHPCYQNPPYPITVTLQRREGNTWQPVLSSVCTLSLMLTPPTLGPGVARTDTLHLVGWRRLNTIPVFPTGPVEGLYRVVYSGIYRKWYAGRRSAGENQLGEPVNDSMLISNPFRVIE